MKGGFIMTTNPAFMSAEEVASFLGSSKAFAYKLIKQLNEEMNQKGYITISGKVNRTYFLEKLYVEGDSNYGHLQG